MSDSEGVEQFQEAHPQTIQTSDREFNNEERGGHKHFNCGEHVLEYAYAEAQGYRSTMEDEIIHYETMPLPTPIQNERTEIKDLALFGVFDGHGGTTASSYAAEQFVSVLQELDGYTTLVDGAKGQEKLLATLLDKAFRKIDKQLQLNVDTHEVWACGSTGCVVFVTPTHFVFGNSGDSRAVLVSDEGIKFHTKDHKPYVPEEARRIRKAGGIVIAKRVNGNYSVSRGFGDFKCKSNVYLTREEQMMIAVPDVTVLERDNVNDQFLIIGCDGCWDCTPNEVTSTMLFHWSLEGIDLRQMLSNLIQHNLPKSRDNCSAVLIALPNAPKEIGMLTPEAVVLNESVV